MRRTLRVGNLRMWVVILPLPEKRTLDILLEPPDFELPLVVADLGVNTNVFPVLLVVGVTIRVTYPRRRGGTFPPPAGRPLGLPAELLPLPLD